MKYCVADLAFWPAQWIFWNSCVLVQNKIRSNRIVAVTLIAREVMQILHLQAK